MRIALSVGSILLVALCALTLMAFNPFGGEPLPTTVAEAETYISNVVQSHLNLIPDDVSCAGTTEEGYDLYKCWVYKSGYDNQLMFVMKGN